MEMGDGAVDVGYDFDYRVWVSWRQVETHRQMPPTRAGIMNQARKRIDWKRCARVMTENREMKVTAPAKVGV